MATDGLSQISNDQLMAMSLMGNGQLTNDSTSSTNDETNYAFQLMLQNYIDSAKNNAKNNVESVANNSAAAQTTTDKSGTENGEVQAAASATSNAASAKSVQQKYRTGQNLLDIPLVVNGRVVSSSSQADYTPSNVSKADLQRIYSAVSDASKKYGVSEGLILAIIKQESDFDSTCTSGAGAAGLMQLMPENCSSLGISDPYNVEQNVNGGTKLLKEYLDQYGGDMQMALMAYNAGPGTMQRRGVSSASDLYKMPKETQNYVPKVMGYYNSGVRS